MLDKFKDILKRKIPKERLPFYFIGGFFCALGLSLLISMGLRTLLAGVV